MSNIAGKSSAPRSLLLTAGSHGRPIPLRRSEVIAASALAALVFMEHLAFGGGRREVALGFIAVDGLFLTALVAFANWARPSMAEIRSLRAPAFLFGLLFLIALWSLTPWTPGGAHPVWSFVPSALPASAIDRSAVLLELIKLAGLACVFAAGWLIGGQDDRARFALRGFVIAGCAYAVWAFFNQMIDPNFLFGVVPMPYSGRLEGSFLSANTAGTFFGVCLVLATCAVMEQLRSTAVAALQKTIERAALPAAASVFSAVCLILTASRGAMIATIVALVVLLTWEGFARRWRLLGPAGAGLLIMVLGVVALLALSGATLATRLIQGGSEAGRAEIAQAHWHAFLARPLLGYGLGGFDGINGLVTTSLNYQSLWNVHAAHNVFLQWLEEGGILGASAMFAAVLAILIHIIRGAQRRVRMTGWLRGVVAVSVVFLVHGLSDFALQIPSMAAFWAALLGLGAGLASPRSARS